MRVDDALKTLPVPQGASGVFAAAAARAPSRFLLQGFSDGVLPSDAFAFMTSRKPRSLCPDTPWLRAAFGLMERLPAGVYVGTLGQAIHDAPLWAAVRFGRRAAVVIPEYVSEKDEPNRVRKAFEKARSRLDNLLPAHSPDRIFLALPVWPDAGGRTAAKERALFLRDLVVAALASDVHCCSVSEGGNVSCVLEAARAAGKRIHTLEVPGHSFVKPQRPRWPDDFSSSPAMELWKGRRWLSHYVRSNPGPWPGQSAGDYYASLLARAPLSAHTAFDALRRIAGEQRIRATARWTRGGRPVASLTEAAPDQVRALHKYMSHLVRWDFEPYAVCIALEAAAARGAVQVAYVDNPHYWRDLPEDKRWWFQPTLRGSRDITLEKEWRIPGDANLAEFPQEDIAFIVASRDEAEILRTCTSCRVEHLFP